MKSFRLVMVSSLALALSAPAALAATAHKPAQHPVATALEIEPAAIQALSRMSAYLSTLTAFDIDAATSRDMVLTDGQTVKLEGVTRYTVRRPDAFVVEMKTPGKVRRLIYNGKSLTLYAPELKVYATVAAPATIRETLDAAEKRYDLHIPLQDLFRWSDPSRSENPPYQAAMLVGPADVDGVATDQYAFRQGDVDWQIWIQTGAQPIPVKVAIIDRSDPARPQFEARLHWTASPQMTADTFAFVPDKDVLAIRLSTLNK